MLDVEVEFVGGPWDGERKRVDPKSYGVSPYASPYFNLERGVYIWKSSPEDRLMVWYRDGT